MKFLYLVLLRLINSVIKNSLYIVSKLLIRSYAAPDEFWQAHEPAHNDVFG